MIISIDGKFVDEKKASYPINSEAFLFGRAVFETIRSYKRKVFRLDDHLARLFVSADIIDLNPKWTLKKAYAEVVKVLEKSKDASLKIRVILTKRHLVITAEKIKEKPKSYYQKGVKLVSFPGQRMLPRAKALADIFTYQAKKHAEESGAYESILVDSKDYVRECAYANIFWVENNVLYTTDKDILFGITRETVIELADEVEFEGKKYRSLLSSDEVFVTQSTSGILPVVEIDGQKIGNGRPGKITKQLMKKFDKLVRGK